MVIISYVRIKEFINVHKEATDTLNNWYRLCEMADWSNIHDIKKVFNSVDAVGNDRYVFNVGGNNYRVVAMIFFDIRTIYIRFVGTHREYDRIKNIDLI